MVKWVSFFLLYAHLLADEGSFLTGELHNDLTYYIHRIPSSQKHIKLDLVVKVGALYEMEAEKGLSHLTEHLVTRNLRFKGVEILNDYYLIWRADSNNRVFSSYGFTQFHFDVSPTSLAPGLLMLSDIPKNIVIAADAFEEEKKEIIDEIFKEEPFKRLEQQRFVLEYPPALGKYLLGSAESISHTTVDQVIGFHRKCYQPARMAIIVVGDVNLQETKELIQNLFGGIPSPTPFRSIPRSEASDVVIVGYQNFGTAHLSFSQSLPKMTVKQHFIFSMGLRYFLKSLKRVTDGTSLNNPSIETIAFPPILRLTFNLPDSDYEKSLAILKTIFVQLIDGILTITQEEFDQLKVEITGSLAQQSSEFFYESLVTAYRNRFLNEMSSPSPFDYEALLNDVTLDEFKQGMLLFDGFLIDALDGTLRSL